MVVKIVENLSSRHVNYVISVLNPFSTLDLGSQALVVR